jgi:hypothetical protein
MNEKLYFSKEVRSIGAAGTMRLLKGKAAKMLNFAGRIFSYTSTRSYGCFLLAFGLTSLLLNLGEYYFMTDPKVALSSIIWGIALSVVSIPLLVLDKPMCIALQDFSVTDYLFFEFLLIKRMHRDDAQASIPPVLALFAGFIPAVVGFFLPIKWVVLAIALTVIELIALTTPEFPVILILLSLPYVNLLPHSEVILIVSSAITLVSYWIKVVIGKRVYSFNIYDIIIGLIILLAFAGGFAGMGADSLKNAFVFIFCALIYFPVSNLVVNRRLADCTLNAVVVSSIPVMGVGISEAVLDMAGSSYVIFGCGAPGISAFFTSTDGFCAFMLVSAMLSFALFIQKQNKAKRAVYFLIFALQLVLVGFALNPVAYLAVLLIPVGYFIINSKSLPADILSLLLVLSHLLLLVPTKYISRALAFLPGESAFADSLAGYKSAFGVFLENIWLGTGIGESSYMAAAGGDTPGAFNLMLGIATELGVFVLSLFIILLFIKFRHISYYSHYLAGSHLGVTANITTLLTFVLVTVGVGSYIFSDAAIMFLFWMIFAISSSALKNGKQEYDDIRDYFGDSSSSESSVIDITVKS